ncbi:MULTISPECIES: polymer-forming cytoskeletal protein [unclassified Janthinobacterium]|uniref:polymer-forming cytoskeletal protein n=1 Tax=unclassified Janthinobacterium TaxID=2610881 RepID=UPI00034DED70|nr:MULTISPECIES: polymer-forming cytoskeletal protein [unclassified Janthinobacterium]MEC5159229.1 MSHA biogenesis protein MshQ [Janthinobacterium sp. CG_S6]
MNIARAIFFLAGLALLGLAVPTRAGNLLFNGAPVASCTLAGNAYTCATLALGGQNDVVTIAGGYAVTVAAGSFDFGFHQGLVMSGSAALTVNGNLDIGGVKTDNLQISGGTLTARGGTFSMGAQAQSIVANIAATTIKIGSGSATKVTGSLSAVGNVDIASHATVVGAISGADVSTGAQSSLSGNVSARGTFTLASGSALQGAVTAATIDINAANSTVNGNLTASTKLSVGANNTVNGNLVSAVVDVHPSGVVVNGNVTASTSLTLGSGDAISGDVVAGSVTLEPAGAYIGGNATVDAITLGRHGRVAKTITCNGGTVDAPCNCVTNDSGYDASSTPRGPSCAAPTPAGPHHILITHPGTALTCQARAVTLTACANAACSAPHYSGKPSVTLTPGRQAVTLDASGVSGAATVRRLTSGAATLAAQSNPAALSNPATCVNAATSDPAKQCIMEFSDAALVLGIPNHRADSMVGISVSAVQASGDRQACVPMFANADKVVNLSCVYDNPATSGVKALLAGTAIACGAGSVAAPLHFDAGGVASAGWKYADVGRISVNAVYSGSAAGGDAGLLMRGSAAFVVAPATLTFDKVWDGATPAVDAQSAASPSVAGAVFTTAGKAFSATITARNVNGATTGNFGAETPRQTVSLAATEGLPAPATGYGGLSGNLAPSFGAGTATVSDLAWSEVGVIKLSAKVANGNGYLGSAGAPTLDSAGKLLNADTGSGNVGRFIPDRFDTLVLPAGALTAGVPMTCIAGVLNCVAPLNGFVYASQGFGLQVRALNADGIVTRNYSGPASPANPAGTNLAKQVLLTGWLANGGTTQNAAGDPRYAAGAGAPMAASLFVLGQARAIQTYVYPAITALPSKVFFRAIDSDRASSLRAVASDSAEAGLTVVSGRMLIPNNYGSELLPMTITVRAQLRNAAGAWITNLADSSALTPSALSLSACTKNLYNAAAASKCKAVLLAGPAGQQPFTGGEARVRLAAPGAGNNGSAIINFLLPGNPSSLYLPSAPAQATFGLYKAGPIIYLRELY